MNRDIRLVAERNRLLHPSFSLLEWTSESEPEQGDCFRSPLESWALLLAQFSATLARNPLIDPLTQLSLWDISAAALLRATIGVDVIEGNLSGTIRSPELVRRFFSPGIYSSKLFCLLFSFSLFPLSIQDVCGDASFRVRLE